MARDIFDNTGTSVATSAEIPRDVTEMVKSTLNAIGGKVVYIPYDPEFMLNSANTGYSGFQAKLTPHVVVSGGITEFDRGLETRGKNTDLSLEGSLDGNALGAEFSGASKTSVASITLDFNLVDFETLAGVSRMQAVNTVKVHKGTAENAIAFSIIGNTIGFQGTVKKVQGRHAAVRVMVHASLIQLLGKHMKLPYWRLLPGAERDPVVIEQMTAEFFAMTNAERVKRMQEYLILNGYAVQLSARLDAGTQQALSEFAAAHAGTSGRVDLETFLGLYESVDISHASLAKRRMLVNMPADDGVRHSTLSQDGLLRLTSSAASYRIGDEIELVVEVARPLYVKIFNISSTGEVWDLFPMENEEGMLLTPGKSYAVPPQSAGYVLQVIGPKGEDRVVALAADKPLSNLPASQTHSQDFSDEVLARFDTHVDLPIGIK